MREVCSDALISARPHDDARAAGCAVVTTAAFAVVFGSDVLVACVASRVTFGAAVVILTVASTEGQQNRT